MADYVGWAVRRVESKAAAPRFQVGTIRGVHKYQPLPADHVPSESERRILEHRAYEEAETYRWEWGHYCDRSDAALALFQKGVSEAVLNRMLDAAAENPGKTARLMLGSDAVEIV
jgi:hypothetical protein